MKEAIATLSAKFVNMHFVNEKYHKDHSQLMHRHDDVLELLYIMHGDGQYIVNGKVYPIQPGNLIICNAGVMHGEAPYLKHCAESYCLVLKDLSLPELPPNTLSKPSDPPVYYFSEDRSAVEHIILALDEQRTQSPEFSSVCNLLANALLNLVYVKIVSRKKTGTLIQKNNEEFIQNILQFLDEHYQESISLQKLGKEFHISPSHLSHIFKTEIGLPPMKYLMNRKIGESQNLLMNTSLPISEISDSLGFNDNGHFSRTFKKYIGVTPSEYRQYFRSSK